MQQQMLMMMSNQSLPQSSLPSGGMTGLTTKRPAPELVPAGKKAKVDEESADDSQQDAGRSPESPRTPLSPQGSDLLDAKELTPPMIRKLLSIASDGEELTKSEASARLTELAKQAEQRCATSRLTAALPAEVAVTQAEIGKPFFKAQQVAEARKAIQALTAAIAESAKKASGSQQSLQMHVKFVHPVASAAQLRAKIEAFNGAPGPRVVVQPLDAESWMKPSASLWYAEKKGDARNCVFRLNIPNEGTSRKAQIISFQVAVGSRELTVKSSKALFSRFAGNLVMLFGPHLSVSVPKVASVGLDLDAFWGTSA